jgi:hypothetical protein
MELIGPSTCSVLVVTPSELAHERTPASWGKWKIDAPCVIATVIPTSPMMFRA